MSLFRLDASIRTEGSVSRALADIVENSWCQGSDDTTVTRRHIGLDPVPATAWAAAVGADRSDRAAMSDDQKVAVDLATTLVDELLDADALLFAVPLYNFGVSQHLKTWIDLVITDPRMGPGGPSAVTGRPGVLVMVRGGNYSEGTPREGWDHATSYYRRILADVWGLDLHVVERQFTLVGVNPALDEFKDLAEELRVKALDDARTAGQKLGAAVGA